MFDKQVLRVDGMSCSHCEAAVVKAVLSVPGVKSCRADAKKGTVTIHCGRDAAIFEKAKAAVSGAGYTVLS